MFESEKNHAWEDEDSISERGIGFHLWILLAFSLFFIGSIASASAQSSGIMLESWGANDSNGNAVSFATLTAGQSGLAQYRTISTTSFVAQSHWAPGFLKASGWIVPGESGNYIFTLTGTSSAQFYLSTDNTPAKEKSVASVETGSQSTSSTILTANSQYYFEVYFRAANPIDQVALGWTLPNGTKVSSIPSQNLVPNKEVGGATWEFWTHIYDQALSALLASKWYPGEPVSRSRVNVFEMKTSVEWAGTRIHGYVLAPQTGTYRFWVAGDDESDLLLSPTQNPNQAVSVASVPNGDYTAFRSWNELPSQKSVPITLQAGQWYYLEGLEVSGHLGGNLSAGWTLPDGTFEGPIPGWRMNPIPGRLGNLPVVRITSPQDGAAYKEGDPVKVTATVTSPDSAITQAKLLCDGNFVASLSAPSYQASIPSVSAGSHKITIQATNGLRETAHDDAGITVFPNPDSKGTGTPPSEQASQTFTTPGSNEITSVQTSFSIDGYAFSSSSAPGDWGRNGNSLLSTSIRGWVEYQVDITSPDVYRVLIQASAFLKKTPDTLFSLGVMIDGVQTDTVTFPSGVVKIANEAATYTPFLSAGRHTVRLIWEDYTLENSISIDGLVLQRLDGPSTNGLGVKDWVASRLHNLNSITVASAENQVSPACIEGTVKTFADMTISKGIVPQRGAGSKWYANIPLTPGKPTQVTVTFENGALPEQKSLSWTPTNLLPGGNIKIRKGDSLLLTAFDPANRAPVAVKIQVPDHPVINTTSTQSVPVEFDQPGTFKVTGTYYAAYPAGSSFNSNVGTSCSYTVTVVDADFGGYALAWNTRARIWDCPHIPADVYVESDPAITFTKTIPQPAKGSEFSALTTNPVDSYVVARLAPGGPILTNAAVRGFWLKSSDEVFLNMDKIYPDGSMKVEMDVVVSLLTPDMNIVMETHNGDVLFFDGTIKKTLTAADFDSHNFAKVFFMVTNTKESICHGLTVYQGDAYVGTR
jgi:hypothetical protein